jgi:hypothetical protein
MDMSARTRRIFSDAEFSAINEPIPQQQFAMN